MSNSRSRKIRRLMAEMGLNYTKAALEMDRRQESADADPIASSDDVVGDRFRLTALHDVKDPSAALAGLPSQEQLDRLSESMDRAAEHAKQAAAIGNSPVLAQIAKMNRAAAEHAKQAAAIGNSPVLAPGLLT